MYNLLVLLLHQIADLCGDVRGVHQFHVGPLVALDDAPPIGEQVGHDVGLGCYEPGRDQGSIIDPLPDGSFHRHLVVGF